MAVAAGWLTSADLKPCFLRVRNGTNLFSEEEAGQKVSRGSRSVAQCNCGTASHCRSDMMTTATRHSEIWRAQGEVDVLTGLMIAVLWLKISCVSKSYDNEAQKNYRLPRAVHRALYRAKACRNVPNITNLSARYAQ